MAASPERPLSPAVNQNCFLWACLLLQILRRGKSKPESSLSPFHLPPWWLRLPAVDRFSCGCMCNSRDDALLRACYLNDSFHCVTECCRHLAVEGNVWFFKGFWYLGSKPVHQLGCRLGPTGLHAAALMHMVGWLLPEWDLLLESPCTLLLFPVFSAWFSGECGLDWCYVRGEGI